MLFESYLNKMVMKILKERFVGQLVFKELKPDKHYLLVLPTQSAEDIEVIKEAINEFAPKRNLLIVMSDNVHLIELT